jgi:hypothetical protein
VFDDFQLSQRAGVGLIFLIFPHLTRFQNKRFGDNWQVFPDKSLCLKSQEKQTIKTDKIKDKKYM